MLYKKTEKLSIIKREGEIMGIVCKSECCSISVCSQFRSIYRQNGIIGIYK